MRSEDLYQAATAVDTILDEPLIARMTWSSVHAPIRIGSLLHASARLASRA